MTAVVGRLGVWRPGRLLTPEYAASLEEFEYSTIWVGGSPPGDLGIVERLLAATNSITVATSIVNIHTASADVVAASYARIQERYAGRFVLGIGVGHRESDGPRYVRPYEQVQRYLDDLERFGVSPDDIMLAALGPRLLRLARDRTAGAHPYLTTPEHTRNAREILGPAPLLAPEQKIVIDRDPARARTVARTSVADRSLQRVNYVSNMRRLGFSDADLAGRGSDALLDALVAHGDPAEAVRRIRSHLDAGASHVAAQVLTGDASDSGLASYQAVAAEFLTNEVGSGRLPGERDRRPTRDTTSRRHH